MEAAATASALRGADAVTRHRPCQLSLFADVVSSNPEADWLPGQFLALLCHVVRCHMVSLV